MSLIKPSQLSEFEARNCTHFETVRDSALGLRLGTGVAMFFNYTVRSFLFLLWPMTFVLGLFVFAPQLTFFGIPPKPILSSVYLSIGTTYFCDCFTFLTSKTSYIYKHKQPLTLGFNMALGITAGTAAFALSLQ